MALLCTKTSITTAISMPMIILLANAILTMPLTLGAKSLPPPSPSPCLPPICYIRYCILYLLYSMLYMYILYICYVFDSKFYILYILHISTSILLHPNLCTRFNILLLVFYLLWLNPTCYIRYCILYLLDSILYMYILYICYVLDSKFYILYILHILTSIPLLPSLCTIFNILLLVSYLL